METKTITEIVQFRALDATKDEQIVDAITNLNEFQQTQDGFLDAELLKETKEDSWNLIYHFENIEKVQAIGLKLRSNSVFSDFKSLVVPESLIITFHHQLRKWQ